MRDDEHLVAAEPVGDDPTDQDEQDHRDGAGGKYQAQCRR
jgi:hypothetical protein